MSSAKQSLFTTFLLFVTLLFFSFTTIIAAENGPAQDDMPRLGVIADSERFADVQCRASTMRDALVIQYAKDQGVPEGEITMQLAQQNAQRGVHASVNAAGIAMSSAIFNDQSDMALSAYKRYNAECRTHFYDNRPYPGLESKGKTGSP